MKKILASAVAITAMTIGLANAATLAVSSTAPTVDGADIAMLTLTDTDWGSSALWGDRPARGQTFTTGSNAGGYTLTSFTLQAAGNQGANGDFNLRVGTISGSDFTAIATETTGTDTTDVTAGDFLTWTLDTPIALAANTVYGFDVGRPGSGYGLYRNSDNSSYSGGSAYSSGSNAVGGATISAHTHDRVFHVDLVAVPEPSTAALLGLGALGLIFRRRRK